MFNFINDNKKQIVKKILKLEDLNISTSILEAIFAHRGVLTSELKNSDRKNTGTLKKYEALAAFTRSQMHPELSSSK